MPSTARNLARTATRTASRTFAAAALTVLALSTAAGVHAAQSTGTAHSTTAAASLGHSVTTPCTMC